MSGARAATTVAVVCLIVAAGLACGNGGDGSAASAEAIAKVKASDYARAVNLRSSDLPYFGPVEEKEEDPREARRRDRELQRCLGVDEQFDETLAEVESPTYGANSSAAILRVQSLVQVAAEAAENARQLKLIRSRRAEACIQRLYVSMLEEEESGSAEVSRASVSRLSFPSPDLAEGFGYRFTARLTVHGDTTELTASRPSGGVAASRTLKVYVDVLGFVVGRAGVTLVASGAPAPVSKNLER